MADEYRAARLPRPHLTNLAAYLEIGANIDHDASESGVALIVTRSMAPARRRERAVAGRRTFVDRK